MQRKLLTAVVLFSVFCAIPVSAAVVNLDFNTSHDYAGGPYADSTHVGADGVLSTTGTFWNGIAETETGSLTLLDEFSNPTSLKYSNVLQTPYGWLDLAGVNNLQDAGNASGGILISGMSLNQPYTVAFYLGYNTGIYGGIDHAANNSDSAITNATPTYTLPGTAGIDYVIKTIVAKDFGGGNVGFMITEGSIDGLLLGLQISGQTIPEPASLALLTGSALLLIRRNRR